MRIREITEAEREALLVQGPHIVRTEVDTPTEVEMLLRSTSNLLDMPMHDISWALRLRLTDLIRQVRVDYPGVIEPANTITLIGTPSGETHTHFYGTRNRVSEPQRNLTPQLNGFRSDQFRNLVRQALAEGWVSSETGTGHVRLTKGERTLIVSKTSTGKGRAWQNLRAQARRAGLNL